MVEKPRLIHFTGIGDEEVGYISVAQAMHHVPFDIKRVYWVYQTPAHIERGNHAHISCMQLLVAVSGRVEIELENVKGEKERFVLSDPKQGLLIPVMHWRKIYLEDKAVLLCLASEDFNENDYIRDYEIFKSMRVQ
jgi:hypothetical protein